MGIVCTRLEPLARGDNCKDKTGVGLCAGIPGSSALPPGNASNLIMRGDMVPHRGLQFLSNGPPDQQEPTRNTGCLGAKRAQPPGPSPRDAWPSTCCPAG